MTDFHRSRIRHREKLLRIFATKPGREAIVRSLQNDLAESSEAIALDDGEDF